MRSHTLLRKRVTLSRVSVTPGTGPASLCLSCSPRPHGHRIVRRMLPKEFGPLGSVARLTVVCMITCTCSHVSAHLVQQPIGIPLRLCDARDSRESTRRQHRWRATATQNLQEPAAVNRACRTHFRTLRPSRRSKQLSTLPSTRAWVCLRMPGPGSSLNM